MVGVGTVILSVAGMVIPVVGMVIASEVAGMVIASEVVIPVAGMVIGYLHLLDYKVHQDPDHHMSNSHTK